MFSPGRRTGVFRARSAMNARSASTGPSKRRTRSTGIPASWTYDPPRRLVQAVDDEARSLIGESDDLAASEPSFPFVPRIARLPRDRPLDRSLDRPSLPPQQPDPAEDTAVTASGERDSLTSLLEAVPSFRGDLVVPERPTEPDLDEQPEPEAEEPPAPAASAGSAYADVLMPRSVGSHRDRLIGSTDRQAEADGVRPGRRAAVPSWDEIVFGTRRKKQE